MNNDHKILFEPMKIGNTELKSRIALAPMNGTHIIEWTEGYEYHPSIREYFLKLAKNNVSLIIPGAIPVQIPVKNAWLHDQKELFEGPIKELIADIHKHDTKIILQLSAGTGRNTLTLPVVEKLAQNKLLKFISKPMMNLDDFMGAPSEIPNVWNPDITSKELTIKKIDKIVDAFGKSALLSKQAGFDGVEIHAIHEGYLLDQFTTKYTNKRTDEYGGSLENRMRFPLRVIKAIKDTCGEDFIISMRYSVESKVKGFNDGAVPNEEYVEVGRDRAESILVAKMLEDAGVHLLNADNGTYDSWYYAHPPVYMPEACNLNESEFIKEHVNIPVLCAGRMENPDIASDSIRNGRIDGVTIGRQLLTDPEWATKVKNAQLEEIKPCIECHNGCMPLYAHKGVSVDKYDNPQIPFGTCCINPPEIDTSVKKDSKKIAVIGGGFAGMEAARVSAIQGHSVTLYEKTNELGGVFIAAASPSFKEKDKQLIEWYKLQLNKLNIDIKLNSEVKDIDQLDADHVIVAIGAKPVNLPVEGITGNNVMQATQYLLDEKEITGETVAIIGGGLTGCEIAYDLALKGKKPFVIEMADDILKVKGLSAANSQCLRQLFKFHKIQVYLESKAIKINKDSITIETNGKSKTIKMDQVIVSAGYTPNQELSNSNVTVIGDANKVGNLGDAIYTAYETALNI
jgi:2-enoate reductase